MQLILLFPGLLAPRSSMTALAKYLQTSIDNAKVETIDLGRSIKSFNVLVGSALQQVNPLVHEKNIKKITLIGFSHGGRVAVAIRDALQKAASPIACEVILMATPIVKKPTNILWHKKILYNLSAAFREWPKITQPTTNSCKYICLYSENDETVYVDSIKTGFTGELVKISDLTHQDFMRPEKVGASLLETINR